MTRLGEMAKQKEKKMYIFCCEEKKKKWTNKKKSSEISCLVWMAVVKTHLIKWLLSDF